MDDDNRQWITRWLELDVELEAPGGEPPRPFERSAEKKDGRNKDEGKSRENNPHRPSADFAALIDAIKKEGIAYRKEERREDRGKKFREWITIGLIACTLVAIGWQVREMVRVYGPISDQAQASRDSAKANIEAAQAATRQSENSDKALTESQRAWVGPSNAYSSGDPVAGHPYDVTLQYQNTGREPAIENSINMTAFTETVQRDQDATQKIIEFRNTCIDRWQPNGGNVVFPSIANTTYSSFKSIDATTIDADVANGTKTIFLTGCFVYKTLDGYHRSSFCYFFKKGITKPANWNICEIGNYAD